MAHSATQSVKKTDIVYIGESSNLKNRINALKNSIGKERGEGSHSGGITLGEKKDKYGKDGLSGEAVNYSICWIKTSEVERKQDLARKDAGPYIAKLFERYLVYTFLITNGEKPIANKE